MLVLPLMFFPWASAGRRIAGTEGMHFSLGLTSLFVLTTRRFMPGSIDHDNVQLCLVALPAAMLADETYRPPSTSPSQPSPLPSPSASAPETTPFVAVACMAVAGLWAWDGEIFAPAARAFALTLTIAVSAAFLALVPPHLYSTVTCDNLVAGLLQHHQCRWRRPAVISAVCQPSVAPVALKGCWPPMASPSSRRRWRSRRNACAIRLADLDPMLVQLWLNSVTEAQSIFALSRHQPETLGAFTATGFLAIVVCIFRMLRGERVRLHAVLLALVAVNWVIALVQVRGAEFSNLLAISPLALLLAELRRISAADTEDMGAAFFYVAATLLSAPAVWAVGGALANNGIAEWFHRGPGGQCGRYGELRLERSVHADSQPRSRRRFCAVQYGRACSALHAASSVVRSVSSRPGRHADRTAYRPRRAKGGGGLPARRPCDAAGFLLKRSAGKGSFETEAGGPLRSTRRGHVPAYLEPIPVAAKSDVQFFRFKPLD